MKSTVDNFHAKIFNVSTTSIGGNVTNRTDTIHRDLKSCEICGFIGSALAALLKKDKKLIIKYEKKEGWKEKCYNSSKLEMLNKNHTITRYLIPDWK